MSEQQRELAGRLVEEFFESVAEKDWPAWAAEVVALLEALGG